MFLIGALFPCLVIALLESGLRAMEYGVNTAPFLRISWNGKPLYLRNDAFIQQFFTSPIVSEQPGTTGYAMPEQAPPDTFGIFLSGSSAATGWPSPEYGFGSILELMLERAHPAVRSEVHVFAVPGVNSHILRALAAEYAAAAAIHDGFAPLHFHRARCLLHARRQLQRRDGFRETGFIAVPGQSSCNSDHGFHLCRTG